MTQQTINPDCKCPYDCPRHGNCTECRAYHSKSGSRTNCMMHGKD